MSEKKLAKVHYADVWGLREEKYKYLFGNDVRATKWQELEPAAPYYFFVPKDFALQAEYEKFWKVTEIFKEWSCGVGTYRDYLVVGFTKEELAQKIRILTGTLPDDMVRQGLNIKDTGSWKFSDARIEIKDKRLEDQIYAYAYRPFDFRWICYEPALVDRDRYTVMRHLIREGQPDNIALITSRLLSQIPFYHCFVSQFMGDVTYITSKTKERSYFFPLYLYPDKSEGKLLSKVDQCRNFTSEFLRAINASLKSEPTFEEIFYFIYAVLYSPTYRKRYEEFLKIDFPRIPLPSDHEAFEELSKIGKELVELHLLKHKELEKTEVGFPKGGSNKVEKVSYAEEGQKVFINKEQYFEGITKEVWEYRIGAYQVMEKYLKDRKGRKLSLDEINHYMKVAKAIRLTIEFQESIDDVYRKIEV
jgi:predicted helicase